MGLNRLERVYYMRIRFELIFHDPGQVLIVMLEQVYTMFFGYCYRTMAQEFAHPVDVYTCLYE